MAMNVDHVHLFIKTPFRKSVYGKMLRCFAIRGTWMGSGGEVYIGTEGLREDRYCTGDSRRKGEST